MGARFLFPGSARASALAIPNAFGVANFIQAFRGRRNEHARARALPEKS
jgi:hypothetical protein